MGFTKKPLKIGFYDIETFNGFEGDVGLVGFKFLDEKYRYFRSSVQFMEYIQSQCHEYTPAIYGFNSARFDFPKIVDECAFAGMRLKLYDMQLSGSLPIKISVRFIDSKKELAEFRELRGIFRAGSLNTIASEVLGVGKIESYNAKNITKIDDECIEYNKRDVELTEKLYKYASDFFNLEVLSTAPSASMKMFTRQYGKENIETKFDRRGTTASYYGGRVEIFKTENRVDDRWESVNCYDINSEYPAAAANNVFPVGELVKDKTIAKDGYSYAKVISPYHYIPYTPHRENGKLLFPHGTLYGTWTNAELRFMKKLGYDINVIWSMVCDESEYVFQDFIKDVYTKRKRAKACGQKGISEMYKLVMNGFYGKFGKKREVDCNKLVPAEDLKPGDETVGTPIVTPNGVMWWVSKQYKSNTTYYDYVIASHITGYGRMMLYEYMIKAGMENMLYCDTDSLFVYENALDEFVSDELGGVKKEFTAKKIIFSRPKVYAAVKDDGKNIVKAKGLPLKDDSGASTSEMIHKAIMEKTPIELTKKRILGIKESMRRSMGKFFNIETQTKKLVGEYDKRVICKDGIETMPLFFDQEPITYKSY